MQTGNFFQVNLDLLYFLGLFPLSGVKMPSSLACTGFSKNRCPALRNSLKISTKRQFTPPGSFKSARRFESTFLFCSLRNFRAWAYHELAMLLWPPNILFHKFANQGARNLLDVHGSLQKFWHFWALITQTVQLNGAEVLFFSQCFSPTNFTDHNTAYYLALEKNIGAMERNVNHALPFQTLWNLSSIGCCDETLTNKFIRYFASGWKISLLLYSLIKINSHSLKFFLSNLNASFT